MMTILIQWMSCHPQAHVQTIACWTATLKWTFTDHEIMRSNKLCNFNHCGAAGYTRKRRRYTRRQCHSRCFRHSKVPQRHPCGNISQLFGGRARTFQARKAPLLLEQICSRPWLWSSVAFGRWPSSSKIGPGIVANIAKSIE
jgi:hypothetical protein